MDMNNNKTEFIFSDEFIGFTTIPNGIFGTKELSYRAIGVYCSILQLQNSPTSSITVKGLASSHKEGRDAVAKAIEELITSGFLEKVQLRDGGKFKGFVYKVYMKPIGRQVIEPITEKPITENQSTVLPITEKPVTENPSSAHHNIYNIYNNNISNNNINNNNIDDDDDKINQSSHKKQINQSSSSLHVIDEPIIKQFKESWMNIVGKRIVLSKERKIGLMGIIDKFGADELLEAINRIPESDYLKSAITINHFIGKFESIANGKYTTWSRVKDNTPVSAAQSKLDKFNSMDSREWDYDEIDELERAYIDRKLSGM